MAAWTKGLAGALLALALARATGTDAVLDRALTDAHWRAQAAQQTAPFPPQIVIVAIDDKSLRRFGRLRYWSRARYAALLDTLSDARAVGLDVLFAEPDARDAAGDRALAEAVRRQGRVVLPLWTWREARPVNAGTQRETDALLARLPRAQMLDDTPPLNPDVLQPPLPALRDAAASLGYADVDADPDGVYRALLIARPTGSGRVIPHFTLAVAALAQKTPLAEMLAPGGVTLGGRTVPLTNGILLLRPRARSPGQATGAGAAIPTVSFADALDLPPTAFAGKIVLVGETATGTPDIRPSALDHGLRGVELNADILATLWDGPPPRPLAPLAQGGLLLAAVVLPLLLFSRFAPRAAIVGAALGLLVLVLILEALFWGAAVIPSWSGPLIGLATATLLMGLQRLGQEEALKRRLRDSFALYVPPQQVERIIRDPAMIAGKAARLRVAVLFSDIRGFTAYVEQNSPELVVRQMEEYLSEMTEAVFAAGGMLDKFIGDAVLALFGPFHEDDDAHNVSARAVACAVDMLARLDALNRRWADEGLPPFKIGIGLSAGEVLFGQIGTPQRLQLTALGDAVNLASRLQTATKDLHVAVLADQAVRDEAEPALRSLVAFADRDTLSVRGRAQAARIFEVFRLSEISQSSALPKETLP